MSLEITVRKLKNRILNSIGRGVVNLIKDSEGLQLLQLSILGADDVTDPVERLQQYGFTSHPPLKSEALVLMIGGTRSHPVCVSVEDRAARKAAIINAEAATGLPINPEDVLLYTTHQNFVLLRAGSGNVIINSPETIRLQAKTIEVAAQALYKLDVSGRGYNYFPLFTDSYEQGTVTASLHHPIPPEHPPLKAQ